MSSIRKFGWFCFLLGLTVEAVVFEIVDGKWWMVAINSLFIPLFAWLAWLAYQEIKVNE